MRWIKNTTRRNVMAASCCALACTLLVLFTGVHSLRAQEGKRVSFYTPQIGYSVSVMDRGGREYVGLVEALEPMGGALSASPDGKKWKLKFRDTESQFEVDKTKARVNRKSITLAAPFLFENGRGLIPLHSLGEVLSALLPGTVDFRESSRKVLIGATPIRFTATKLAFGKVAFTFSSPVNPFIATEAGRLRMVFTRDALQSELQSTNFGDALIPSASYSENNGALEMTVLGTAPLFATFSEDRKTITVSAVQSPQAQAATAPQASARAPNMPGASGTTPAPRPHPLRPVVIIDAAHGGSDRGAALSDKFSEKDVTLAVARRLKHELDARGIPSILLRDGDVSLTMEQRAQIANGASVPLYIAVHASAASTGVRLYTAMVSPRPHKPLAFLPVGTAQGAFVENSRNLASSLSIELLKRDIPNTALVAAVAPLAAIGTGAMAVEISPVSSGATEDLIAPAYQQSVATAIANSLAALRTRLGLEAAQ